VFIPHGGFENAVFVEASVEERDAAVIFIAFRNTKPEQLARFCLRGLGLG
jgi:hypothetical protein